MTGSEGGGGNGFSKLIRSTLANSALLQLAITKKAFRVAAAAVHLQKPQSFALCAKCNKALEIWRLQNIPYSGYQINKEKGRNVLLEGKGF